MTAMPATSRRAVPFNVEDALDALARSDHGDTPRPGDGALIDAYERHCQAEWDRYEHAHYKAERQRQIAEAIEAHADDCEGDGCDHWTNEEN